MAAAFGLVLTGWSPALSLSAVPPTSTVTHLPPTVGRHVHVWRPGQAARQGGAAPSRASKAPVPPLAAGGHAVAGVRVGAPERTALPTLAGVAAAAGLLVLALVAYLRRPAHTAAEAVALAAVTGETAAAADDSDAEAPQWMTYEIKVRKPLGLVMEENKASPSIGAVFVAECIAGGNGGQAGIKPGDVLQECSAVTLKTGKEGAYAKQGYGARPFDNFERITFDTRGQTFDNVMAALGSNSERWGYFDVDLKFARRADEAKE
uniref:PDZ domain-containing protein n=1 Tax=Eutreptiella gymnastica TaxID=73025 RepID=A0A7S4FTI1_9EUGL